MLEKPDLEEEKLIACCKVAFGFNIVQVSFLPLGADKNTAVYRVESGNGGTYFLKLRQGEFDKASVLLPKFLSAQGIRQIIPPVETRTGKLWAILEEYKVILYPYIPGKDGYQVVMSPEQWVEFGNVIKKVHYAEFPDVLAGLIRREDYSSTFRQLMNNILDRIERESIEDPLAGKLAEILNENRKAIRNLIGRAEQLAQQLQLHTPDFVLCHSDIHGANILIADDQEFYIVDWDDPIFAPKERDLMFIGVNGFPGYSAQDEEALFYHGYGQTEVDPIALAYYRYERIVQDVALFSELILSTEAGETDKEQSLEYLMSNFLPGSAIEIAYQTDKTQGV